LTIGRFSSLPRRLLIALDIFSIAWGFLYIVGRISPLLGNFIPYLGTFNDCWVKSTCLGIFLIS